jgi:hypothetical protein
VADNCIVAGVGPVDGVVPCDCSMNVVVPVGQIRPSILAVVPAAGIVDIVGHLLSQIVGVWAVQRQVDWMHSNLVDILLLESI